MRSYSDPTANAAIGTIEREFRAKKKLAKHLKDLRRAGRLTEEAAMEASKQFTGIYRRIFGEVLKD